MKDIKMNRNNLLVCCEQRKGARRIITLLIDLFTNGRLIDFDNKKIKKIQLKHCLLLLRYLEMHTDSLELLLDRGLDDFSVKFNDNFTEITSIGYKTE